MVIREWKAGDKVRHTGRPEWGIGSILKTEPMTHEGKRCQRVSVRFERAGSKTLSTAFAALIEAGGIAVASEPDPLRDAIVEQIRSEQIEKDRDGGGGHFRAPSNDSGGVGLAGADLQELLIKVPEAASDPFIGLRKRVANTLALYRFNDAGGSLLDWAAMQTGLKDPLSRLSRHELESLFRRFQRNLEEHLRKLWREMKKQDPAGIAEVLAAAPPQARNVVRRVDAMC
jgi:hypothetical protein